MTKTYNYDCYDKEMESIEEDMKGLCEEVLVLEKDLKNILGNDTTTLICVPQEQKNECNCIVNKAWDAGKSFVSGLIWIAVVFFIIVSILYWLGF